MDLIKDSLLWSIHDEPANLRKQCAHRNRFSPIVPSGEMFRELAAMNS
jgi:hypothetical protein